MLVPRVLNRDWWAGTDPGMTMFRFVGANKVPLVIGDVVSWSCKVFDKGDGPSTASLVASLSGIGPDVMFDTLQYNDGYWTRGYPGYNFRHYTKNTDATLAPNGVFEAGHTYRWEYYIVTMRFGISPQAWGTLAGVREGTCAEVLRT